MNPFERSGSAPFHVRTAAAGRAVAAFRAVAAGPAAAVGAWVILALIACGAGAPPEGASSSPPEHAAGTPSHADALALAPEQEEFWASMRLHCGNAYAGRVSDATSYYRDGVVGRTLVADFLECDDDRMHVALHIDDNRSRNWILTRAGGTIRLKHDHRHADGTEEEISQYGGDAPSPGLRHRQIFPADAHTARILPQRADNFWFLELVDGRILQYGVHWPTAGHSIRLEFDLATPVDSPPRPWGY